MSRSATRTERTRTARRTSDRDTLVHDHLDLADRLARRFVSGSTELDDLRQVARLGLCAAADRYDPDAGVFVRFATVTIVGELKKYLRTTGWAVHVPRRLQEDALTVNRTIDDLTTSEGRSPTVADVATSAHLTREQVVEALRANAGRYRSAAAMSDDGVSADTDVEVQVGMRIAVSELRAALAQLDDDDRTLLAMRFVADLRQGEIGAKLGISQPQAHRRIRRALDRLRDAMNEAPP